MHACTWSAPIAIVSSSGPLSTSRFSLALSTGQWAAEMGSGWIITRMWWHLSGGDKGNTHSTFKLNCLNCLTLSQLVGENSTSVLAFYYTRRPPLSSFFSGNTSVGKPFCLCQPESSRQQKKVCLTPTPIGLIECPEWIRLPLATGQAVAPTVASHY